MFCPLMFGVLESLINWTYEWCGSTQVVIPTATTCLLLVISVVSVHLILWKGRAVVSAIYYRFTEEHLLDKLYKAVQDDDVPRAVSILERNPSLTNTFKEPEGYTPFMAACANANTQLVRFMLRMGANVALKSKNNETAFYLTAFYYVQNKNCKNATCIRELFHAGANIDEPGRNDFTPLQMAAIFGHVPLIKWLLLKKAKMDTWPHPHLLAKTQGHQEAANLLATTVHIRSIRSK
ncbi:ankyrin repeat, SAM and basic leucine zipper domain-containing protein 1-like [Anthonomus grandis grandis]|uniref:ankyrin repeat, SAM and basic leucine zipper domain-containing protein 1-like n=1 Tax=Anthonomus grandis grandis TaxID=2921223 RepID=UPI002165E341|nr:ankyrin repeat, SAM and basic leucine zipper domain-containing protein 1-like [Anthonomus grandis grandis]